MFLIGTYHASLRFLKEQKITNALQQKWLYKLMGYDFTIEYKQGKANLVADALSRKQEYMEEGEEGAVVEEGSERLATLNLVTTKIQPDWVTDILTSYLNDQQVAVPITASTLQGDKQTDYSVLGGVLKFKGRIVLVKNGSIRTNILKTIHETAVGGHSGIHTTYLRAKGLFYWKGIKADVEAYIQGCDTCKQCKDESVACPGLLQPLPIPNVP